jgi:hypothetical protein
MVKAVTKKTALVTGARNQRVVIEYHYPAEWMVMHADGSVEMWDTASHAFRSVQRAARRRNVGVTITSIEWRDVPAGFVPPTE